MIYFCSTHLCHSFFCSGRRRHTRWPRDWSSDFCFFHPDRSVSRRDVGLVTFFRDETVTEPNLRSVAILAAVREREAAYVWSAQVGAARRNGVSEDVIDLLRAKADPGKLPLEEREIATYVRQLMRTNRI